MIDNSAELALRNQEMLDKQFAQAFSPLNNYAAQNLQLGMAQRRAEQERAQRIYEMQLQQQFAKEREANQYDYNRRLAKQAEDAAFHSTEFVQGSTARREEAQTRLNFNLQDQKQKDAEANALRENPDVKRILGSDVNNFKDTPEGNAALIAYWHAKTADPKVQEELNTSKVENWAKQARQVINSMTSISPGSEEGRKAVMTFLQQPGVVQLLTSKGDLTTDDVNKILSGGDPSKVIAAIKQVGDNSFWSLTGQTREAQLMTAWSTALATSQGQPSGSGITKMNFLQNMLKNIDTVMPNLTSEDSLNRVSKALGVTTITPKTPPPPQTGTSPVSATQTSTNPFPQPVNNTVGLNALVTPSPAGQADETAKSLANPNLFQLIAGHSQGANAAAKYAFSPQRLASDPYTELETRKKLLDNARLSEERISGLASGLGINYAPKMDAYKQTALESQLTNIVKGLYSPPDIIPQQIPDILQNQFQGPPR